VGFRSLRVTRDTCPTNALHASGDHLVGTLVWVVPFGYVLERRRPRWGYVGLVVVGNPTTTTLAPVVFVVLGVAPGLGSGVAHALVGREATARRRSLPEWRSFSRVEDRILAVAAIGVILNLLGFLHTRHERASSGTRPGC
jgi:membrane associated rhomboid family serine protease